MLRKISPLTILIFISIIGCSNNENSQGTNSALDALPIGYSSNENHENSGGNVRLMENDNDGPLIEMLDHTLGAEGQIRREQRNTDDRYNHAIFNRNGREKQGEFNGQPVDKNSTYFTEYDGELSMEISQLAASVVNVADAQALIHDHTILLGVALEDPARREETEAAIHDVIDKHTKGKDVRIVVDDELYRQIWTMDNVLRQGAPVQEAKKEIKNLIDSTNK